MTTQLVIYWILLILKKITNYKLENQDNEATMFFIIKKSEEPTFIFSQNSDTIIYITETQKIANLLNASDNENSKFAIKNGM